MFFSFFEASGLTVKRISVDSGVMGKTCFPFVSSRSRDGLMDTEFKLY